VKMTAADDGVFATVSCELTEVLKRSFTFSLALLGLFLLRMQLLEPFLFLARLETAAEDERRDEETQREYSLEKYHFLKLVVFNVEVEEAHDHREGARRPIDELVVVVAENRRVVSF